MTTADTGTEGLRLALTGAFDTIVLDDRHGMVVEANPMAEALLARERRDLIRHALVELQEPHAAESLPQQLEALFECPSKEASFETILWAADQNPRPVRLRARLVQEVGTEPLVEVNVRDADRAVAEAESILLGNRALR